MLDDSDSGILPLSARLVRLFAKIITKRSIAVVRHNSLFDSAEAFIIDFFEEKVVLRFCNKLGDAYFFPGDSLSFSTVLGDKIHIISSEILEVDLSEFIQLTVKPKTIESKLNLRCHERFSLYPPLSARLGYGAFMPDTENAIVKNISLNGLKLNSKKNFEINDVISAIIIIDKENKIACKCKVVKKNKLDSFYIYGVTISKISKFDSNILNRFINKLQIDYDNKSL